MAIYNSNSSNQYAEWGYCHRCNNQTRWSTDDCSQWICQKCSEYLRKCEVLGYQPNIDAQINSAERRVMELLARKEAMEKFDLDFDVDDAILWKRTFKDGPSYNRKQYTYVAVKTPVGWYITGKGTVRWSWETLVEQHLMEADEVWVCKEWGQIS